MIYDLVIVGAGPAGLSLAYHLADSGLKIFLIDKKKDAGDVQYKTAGSFIDPEEYKIPRNILNPLSELYLSSKNEVLVVHGKAYVIDRVRLLGFLEKKAMENKNLVVHYNSKITSIESNGERISSIRFTRGKNKEYDVCGRVYADCSGSGWVLGRRIGLGPKNPHTAVGVEYIVPLKQGQHTCDLFLGEGLKGGYGGIFPLNAKLAVVGYYTLSKERFPHVESHLKSMWDIPRVDSRCQPKPMEKHTAVLRTGMPQKRLVKNNLVLIGDSGVQANPLVGEGIRFVMDASKMASKWIRDALKSNNLSLLKNYEREWCRKYYNHFRTAFMIQHCMRVLTAHDRMTDRLVRRLKKLDDPDFVQMLRGDLGSGFLLKMLYSLI